MIEKKYIHMYNTVDRRVIGRAPTGRALCTSEPENPIRRYISGVNTKNCARLNVSKFETEVSFGKKNNKKKGITTVSDATMRQ